MGKWSEKSWKAEINEIIPIPWSPEMDHKIEWSFFGFQETFPGARESNALLRHSRKDCKADPESGREFTLQDKSMTHETGAPMYWRSSEWAA